MEKVIIVLLLATFFSDAFGESQTCKSVTTTTCDHYSLSPSSPNQPVKRGKMGPKGEKGERGPGGIDQSVAVLELSKMTAQHDEEIKILQGLKAVHSSQLSELSELYLMQNKVLLVQNITIESLVNELHVQNNKIEYLMKSVKELSSKYMSEFANVRTCAKNNIIS